jgi:ComF family protein
MWRAPANAFIRVLLAPACAACRTELAEPLTSPVCPRCWSLVAPVPGPACATCGDALAPFPGEATHCARCQAAPPSYDRAASAGRYDGALREVIHVFKFEGRRLLAEPLGRLMRERGADLLSGADAAVPVPLHPIRAMQRGFNQADDLARQLGLPVWHALRRRRHGPAQASLTARQRESNLTTAFALSRSWLAVARLRPRRALEGRVVVLVDDVMTTGATVEACSDVLLAAGVRTVRVLTAARAVAEPRPRRPPPPLPSSPPHR